MEQLLSLKQLAVLLGIAEQTIYNRHSVGGDLPTVIKLGRLIRFKPSDVEQWLDKKSQVAASGLINNQCSALPIDVPVSKRRGRPCKTAQRAARELI